MMSWALLAIVILLAAIILLKGIQMIMNRKLQQGDNTNRYRNRTRNRRQQSEPEQKKEEPTLGKNPLEDADTILGLTTAATAAKKTAKSNTNSAPLPDKFIVIYLRAEKNRPYSGYELLQALLSSGLRFGEKRLFHRHTDRNGQGERLFSLASATAPGIFDLSKMGGYTTEGLSLFFKCQQVNDVLASFDSLLETANELAEELGGQLLDEQGQLFNPATAQAIRQQLVERISQQATEDMFA